MEKKGFWQENIYILVLAIVILTVLSVFAIIYRDWVQELEGFGYFGLFILNILASAVVIIPIPAIVAVFTMGGILNPFIVGAVAGIGEGMGGLTGYMLGHGGRAVLNNSLNGSKTYHSIYARIEKWMESRGALTIFLGSAVVNPFFLPMGAAAATVRFPAWKFFLLCWAGKTTKGIIIALLGSLGLKVIFRAFGIPL